MTMTEKKIQVVPYNLNWPAMFEVEAQKIREALGDNCIAVHHVGSTSVPGLAAKPIIDIIAVINAREKVVPALESLGYQSKGEYNIPMRLYFSKETVNLHVYEDDNPEIELNLLFRGYLRNNSDAKDEYAALKEKLLQQPTSFEKNNSSFTGYNLGKDAFIRKILQQAGFKRTRLAHCAHYAEWEAAKHFRQKYFFDTVPIADPYTWTFTNKDHVHFVLYQGAEIVGYAHLQLWSQQRAAIRIIVVDEVKRASGLGGQLLDLSEKWLKSQGYKSVHTESSPAALGFYQKHNYVNMPFNDPDGYDGGAEDIPLGKIL